MSLADPVLAVSHDLPIRTTKAVHNGKVRSLYWLTDSDSQRLIREKNYDVAKDSALAIMVISDRISAFDCIFHGENNLQGVPGKGVALNAISNHWFKLFQQQGLADNHILDIPHPLVWIVQKARPIKIEAIIRQYISGSMWRAYDKGAREFCGITLPDGLIKNQKLPQLLITPSTKGVLSGLAGVPELDDTNICRSDIEAHFQAFGFDTLSDIDKYEELLTQGFSLISNTLATLDQLFVDTKFEFGYVKDKSGCNKLIYMDEVGTPDSSRIWDASAYREGKIVENSKEGFRQMLLDHFPDPDILLNSDRMPERKKLAQEHALPLEMMLSLSRTYTEMAEKITGQALIQIQNPRAEIIHVLGKDYGLID